MRKTAFWAAFALIFSVPLFSQTKIASPDFAQALYDRAKSLRRDDKPDSALILLKIAQTAFLKEKRCFDWLYAVNEEASIEANERNNPFEALDMMEQALAELSCKPASTDDFVKLCFFHLDIAFIAKQNANDFFRVKTELLEGYKIFKENLGGKHDDIAKFLYFQLGNTYVRLGDYESARLTFEEGVNYAKTNSAPKVAKFSDFGDMYVSSGDYEKAIHVFRQGLAFKGISREDSITLKISEAECLIKLGQVDAALTVNKIVEKWIGRLNKDHRVLNFYLASLYGNYGLAAAAKKDFQSSVAWFDKAITTAKERYGNTNIRWQAFFHIDKANAIWDSGNANAAMKAYDDALETLSPGFVQNQKPSAVVGDKVFIQALEGKSKCHQAQNQLEKALDCLELIPHAEAKLRETHAYESSSLLAMADSRRRFDRAVALAWKLSKNGTDKNFTARAFRLTEQARALLLLQSLARAKADYQLSEENRRLENALRSQTAWLETQIGEEKQKGANADAGQVKKHEKALHGLKQEMQKFREGLKKSDPVYAKILDEIALLNAPEVRGLLRSKQALIDFYLIENEAFVFFFLPNGDSAWRKIPLPENFRGEVRQLVEYLSKKDQENSGEKIFQSLAGELFGILLAPEIEKAKHEGIKSLVIVPDDVLAFLPFEILLTQPVGNSGWTDHPYLLQDFSIAYAFSATLLRMQREISDKRQQQKRQFWAGFAPVYHKSQSDTTVNGARGILDNLKYSQDEVRTIGQQMSGRPVLGDSATEANFMALASYFRVLHLAMHAIANEENPGLSRLLFGDRIEKPIEPGIDNILYANELQLLRLQADLAVLSACHTGRGRWHKGEGVYSLARAFASAGVPATVMSLWQLPDDSAPLLMEAFYKHLTEGFSKDEALRLAKLDYLKNPDRYYFSHPYYWAGIVANGDMRPIVGKSWNWFWVAGLGVLALLIFVFWKKRHMD